MRPRCGRLAPVSDIRAPSELNRDTDPSRQTPSPTRVCGEADTWPVGDCREDATSRKATFHADSGEVDDGEIAACELVDYGLANSHGNGEAPRRVSALQPRVAAPQQATTHHPFRAPGAFSVRMTRDSENVPWRNSPARPIMPTIYR